MISSVRSFNDWLNKGSEEDKEGIDLYNNIPSFLKIVHLKEKLRYKPNHMNREYDTVLDARFCLR